MWWMKIDENLKSIDRYDGYHNGKSDKDNNTIRPKPHCPTAIFPFLPILLNPTDHAPTRRDKDMFVNIRIEATKEKELSRSCRHHLNSNGPALNLRRTQSLALAHLGPVAPKTTLAADSDGTAELLGRLVNFDGIFGSEHEHFEEELGGVLLAGGCFGAEVGEVGLGLGPLAGRGRFGGADGVVGGEVLAKKVDRGLGAEGDGTGL